MICKNTTHPILKLTTDKNVGEEISFYEAENEEDEALYLTDTILKLVGENNIKLSDIAILYRTNAQSRVIEEVFLHRSIPYILIGGIRFYERKEIKDIISYLRLLINPNDKVSLDRIKKIRSGKI
ncbi:MAG: hypothetical protein KatS3mg092_0908 [Patescibacteria group bacterium]|nr:MAG: hypothetical protein KatS3mg092_0908 [Patescibacteria group bacterium]